MHNSKRQDDLSLLKFNKHRWYKGKNYKWARGTSKTHEPITHRKLVYIVVTPVNFGQNTTCLALCSLQNTLLAFNLYRD